MAGWSRLEDRRLQGVETAHGPRPGHQPGVRMAEMSLKEEAISIV